MRTATIGERLSSAYAATIIALRPLVAVAWIAAAVAAWLLLPPLGGSGSAPLGDILPPDSRALATQERALKLFGSTAATDTVIVQHQPDGLSSDQARAHLQGARAVQRGELPRELRGVRGAIPLVNQDIPGVRWGEERTGALTYLFMGADLNLSERNRATRAYAAKVLRERPGGTVGVTGAGPARLEQFRAIDGVLGWITLATVAVILLIVAAYFRSIGAPLVTLVTVAVAYVVAIRVLAWAGERAGVTAPSEIEPVLVVLLLGLVTDYTIFFMSEARRRMLRGEAPKVAARRATARITPIVLTAGVLVAGCSASLLAGRMDFFRVFGPGLAVSALVVTVVCITLVPALIGLGGPRLFGRAVREAAGARRPERPPPGAVAASPDALNRAGRRRERLRMRFAGPLGALRASRREAETDGGRVLPRLLARGVATRPVAFVLTAACVAVLAVAATGVSRSDLAVSFIPSLPADSEPRRAADVAVRAFAPGVLAPTEVVLERPGIADRRQQLARLRGLVAREPGVAVAAGPGQPIAEEIDRALLSEDGAAARLVLILDHEPTGSEAIHALERLEARLPALARRAGLGPGLRIAYGGETALAVETVDSLVADLRRIVVAALLVTFLLLALFLRALVAPLLLVFASALAYAGSLGLTALLLPHVFGPAGFVYYVPLVAAVLLVGLGSDYNVFIAGRIREEARRRRLREAIAVATPSASKAITVAGVTLAGTFALLAIVPLRSFRELALLMFVGVLVDALLVRPLLIPALIALAGRLSWWPGKPQRPPAERALLERVAARTEQSRPDAQVLTEATLRTLAERIPEREARELAGHLPAPLAALLVCDPSRCEPFAAREFIRRVAGRAEVHPAVAREDVRDVLAVILEVVPQTEVDYVRAALSEDYRELLGDTGVHALPGSPAPAPVRA